MNLQTIPPGSVVFLFVKIKVMFCRALILTPLPDSKSANFFFFFGRGLISGEIVSKPNLMGGAFYSFSWQVVLGGRQMGV